MPKANIIKRKNAGVGYLINSVQTLFVGVLRIWTIPIVLMLSVASGFTTFYGLSNFITPWIALVITVAIQSIIVICSLEIAGIHWKANRVRYFSVVLSLLIAIAASISFSYFKFYEISHQDTIHIDRLNQVRQNINQYVNKVLTIKGEVLKQKNAELKQTSEEVTQAYFGTHPSAAEQYKDQVGKGPFWEHYNDIHQGKKKALAELERQFLELDKKAQTLQVSLEALDVTTNLETTYYSVLDNYKKVQLQVGELSNAIGDGLPKAPLLMTYKQFVQDVKPNFSMWNGFDWFAFICAAMVDFFTVLLSYRLEFTAPGPLTEEEENLVFDCLRQFTEFKINENDELQMVIAKTEIEKARRYSDWSRMFAVGLLLNRGFLRKIDDRTVEFAPNLYPLVAEKMSDKINQLRVASSNSTQVETNE